MPVDGQPASSSSNPGKSIGKGQSVKKNIIIIIIIIKNPCLMKRVKKYDGL
jgi:hypothetical protein